MKSISFSLVILTITAFMKGSCNTPTVEIHASISKCINPALDTNKMHVLVNNKTGYRFYMPVVSFYYKMDIVSETGSKIQPKSKGGMPIQNRIIPVSPGRHEYELEIPFLKNYELDNGQYELVLQYGNSQKRTQGKRLLIGEHIIPRIPFTVCVEAP